LFHADRRKDGRADMTKLIVAFRNFANASKKGLIYRTVLWTSLRDSFVEEEKVSKNRIIEITERSRVEKDCGKIYMKMRKTK